MSNPSSTEVKRILDEALTLLVIRRSGEQVSLSEFQHVLRIVRASSSVIDKSRLDLYEIAIQSQEIHDKLKVTVSEHLNDYLNEDAVHVAGVGIARGYRNRLTVSALIQKLIELAIGLGSREATDIFIDSLESQECVYGRYTLIGGITTDHPTQLCEGVSVMPLPNVVQPWPENFPTFLPDSELLHRFRKAAIIQEEWSISPRFLPHDDPSTRSTANATSSPFTERAKSQEASDFDPYLFCIALSLVIRHKAYVSMRWSSMSDDELINLPNSISFQYEIVQSPEDRVEVSAEQFEEAKKLHESMKSTNQEIRKQLTIPITRLIESTSRPKLVDTIIDLAIALESLYLPGIRSELDFRLRLRAAKHSEDSLEKRAVIAQQFRAFYQARSDAVHTGQVSKEYDITKSKTISVSDLILTVQDVCRGSIIKILTDDMPNWTQLDFE